MYKVGDIVQLKAVMAGCKQAVIAEVTNCPKNRYGIVHMSADPYGMPKRYLASDDMIQQKVGTYDGPLLKSETPSDNEDDVAAKEQYLNSLAPGDPIDVIWRGSQQRWAFVRKISGSKNRFAARNPRGSAYKFPLANLVLPSNIKV